jgi:hypothetical protein
MLQRKSMNIVQKYCPNDPPIVTALILSSGISLWNSTLEGADSILVWAAFKPKPRLPGSKEYDKWGAGRHSTRIDNHAVLIVIFNHQGLLFGSKI